MPIKKRNKKDKRSYSETISLLEKRIPIIIRMWNTHTLEEIAKELGISKQRVYQINWQLRRHGVNLPRKRCPKIDWEKLVKKFSK